MISMIGSRSQSGTLRWTFDWLYLWDGVPLVPVTLGLFAMPELGELAVVRQRIAGEHAARTSTCRANGRACATRAATGGWSLRCSVLGTALGAIPGLGSAVIDWIAYGYAQRTEKNPETFGTGDVRGVIAPESSNNAKEGGHLVPTIAFGVPAGASMAILLGAFLMHGLTPGPEMLTKHLDVTYTIVWSLTLAHVIGALICLSGSRWLAQISTVRPRNPAADHPGAGVRRRLRGLARLGRSLLRCSVFGIVGWIMKRLGWPRPPLVLGLVIGGIFERYLFISTELYGVGWLLRPVVLVILCLRGLGAVPAAVARSCATWSHELREVKHTSCALTASATFTLVVMAFIVAAVVVARLAGGGQAGAADRLLMALTAAGLNLVNELFGKELVGVGGSVDGGSRGRRPCRSSTGRTPATARCAPPSISPGSPACSRCV